MLRISPRTATTNPCQGVSIHLYLINLSSATCNPIAMPVKALIIKLLHSQHFSPFNAKCPYDTCQQVTILLIQRSFSSSYQLCTSFNLKEAPTIAYLGQPYSNLHLNISVPASKKNTIRLLVKRHTIHVPCNLQRSESSRAHQSLCS